MYRRSIVRFMRCLNRTWKQKLCAVGLIAIGVLTAILSEGDITALIFLSIFAIPMFLSKGANWIA